MGKVLGIRVRTRHPHLINKDDNLLEMNHLKHEQD